MDPTTQVLLDSLEQGFHGVHSRLDTINGKVYRHERDIAVLQNDAAQQREQTRKLDDLVDLLQSIEQGRGAVAARQVRDVKVIAALLGGLMGLVSVVAQFLPLLF